MLGFIHFAVCLAQLLFVDASPIVQLGGTTLVGLDLPVLKQEFFGGEYSALEVTQRTSLLHSFSPQVFPLWNLRSESCVCNRLSSKTPSSMERLLPLALALPASNQYEPRP